MDDLGRWFDRQLEVDRLDAEARRGVFPSPGVEEDGAVWLHIRPGGNATIVWLRDPAAGYDDMAKLRDWAYTETGWTQERVLCEIEAKRQIVKVHFRRRSYDWDEPGVIGFECAQCCDRFPCATLRLLALPYAVRPGYREEWRP